jgi:hypothetical protein
MTRGVVDFDLRWARLPPNSVVSNRMSTAAAALPARPPKSKHGHPPPPPLGQNAKSLAELLKARRDEYIYNTQVPPSLPLRPTSATNRKNLLRTARKAAMRAAKRQLDACGTPQPLRINKPNEPDPGQSFRCAIDVRAPCHASLPALIMVRYTIRKER